MKITLISLLSATFLGFVAIAGGLRLHFPDLVAGAFAVGLAAWTFAQYSRKPRVPLSERVVHLPVHPAAHRAPGAQNRLAA